MVHFLAIFLVFNSYASSSSPMIIYGQDNRVEVEDVKNPKIRKLADSIAVKVSSNILDSFYSHHSFNFSPKLGKTFGVPMCIDQSFSTQPAVADCTGFLIGEDILVTAGHCVLNYDGNARSIMTPLCARSYWMFDYKYDDGFLNLKNVNNDNVYLCDEVISATLSDVEDFAIIRLDRKVVDRKPLKLRGAGRIQSNAPVFTIGSPSGLPLKYTDSARVISNNEDAFFVANLDTFGGNSGSPVFNAKTLEVEGVLIRGRTDYVFRDQSCMAVNKCDEFGKNCNDTDADFDIDGEHVLRIDKLDL